MTIVLIFIKFIMGNICEEVKPLKGTDIDTPSGSRRVVSLPNDDSPPVGYTGDFINGKRERFGVQKFENGDIYEG